MNGRNRRFHFISLMAARRDNCRMTKETAGMLALGNIHPMNRCSRSWESVFAGVGLRLPALDGPAAAADMPLKAPVFKAVYNWTGFYLGGHVGYGGGRLWPGHQPPPRAGGLF